MTIAGRSSESNSICFSFGLALSGIIPVARPQDTNDVLAEIERLPRITGAGQGRHGALQAQWHRVDHQGPRAPFEPAGLVDASSPMSGIPRFIHAVGHPVPPSTARLGRPIPVVLHLPRCPVSLGCNEREADHA